MKVFLLSALLLAASVANADRIDVQFSTFSNGTELGAPLWQEGYWKTTGTNLHGQSWYSTTTGRIRRIYLQADASNWNNSDDITFHLYKWSGSAWVLQRSFTKQVSDRVEIGAAPHWATFDVARMDYIIEDENSYLVGVEVDTTFSWRQLGHDLDYVGLTSFYSGGARFDYDPSTSEWVLSNQASPGTIYPKDLGLTVTTDWLLDSDFDGDNDVDLDDFNILKDNFGIMSGMTFVDGDEDGDGDIDLTDFNIFKQNFGDAGGDPGSLEL